MADLTIYHQIRGMMSGAAIVRICPVTTILSGSVHNVQPADNHNKIVEDRGDYRADKTGKNIYFYYKLSKVQLFFNIIYIVISIAMGIVSQAFLLNICQNMTQVLGYIVHMFTELVFPLGIIIFTNKNTWKVRCKTNKHICLRM